MAPGRKTGGRTKGTPNKATSVMRQAFCATFGALQGDLEDWIRQTAEGVETQLTIRGLPAFKDDGTPIMVKTPPDPGKAADLTIRIAEYHVPKLGRTEVVGEGGGPVEYVIRDLAKEES